MQGQLEYETILDFGVADRQSYLPKKVPIEQMPSAYIPKTAHDARLKFYRLENLRANVRNQSALFDCFQIDEKTTGLNLRIGGLQSSVQQYLMSMKLDQIKKRKALQPDQFSTIFD